MKLMFCQCYACRLGRKTKGGRAEVLKKKRGARRACKMTLKRDDWEMLPDRILVGYTD